MNARQIQRQKARSWNAKQGEFWRRQLRIAKCLNLITAVAAGITAVAAAAAVFTLVYLYRTLKATESAANAANNQAQAALIAAGTAQKQLELSERPWVSADVSLAGPLIYKIVAGPRIYEFSGAQISLRIVLKNTGNSPAVAVSVQLAAYPNYRDDALEQQHQLCDPLRRYAFNSGPTIFPGQTMKEVYSLTLSLKDIEKATRGSNAPFIDPMIIGCVDYGFEFKPEHHQTGFISTIARFGKANAGLTKHVSAALARALSNPKKTTDLSELFGPGNNLRAMEFVPKAKLTLIQRGGNAD